MKLSIKRLVIDSMLAALCAVLGFYTLQIGNTFKFTFENLPVIIGALLFGPIDGMLIGGVGSFITQALGPYGLEATTILWVIPYVVSGLMLGFIAEKKQFRFKPWELTILLFVNAALITVMNTVGLIIDSKIKEYHYAVVWTSFMLKIGIGAIKAVAYTFLVPVLLKAIRRLPDVQATPGRKTDGQDLPGLSEDPGDEAPGYEGEPGGEDPADADPVDAGEAAFLLNGENLLQKENVPGKPDEKEN
ncbi:MAG: ECF transporter S component [Lachnospiraceae bacterium]|nr:ECF transporter S component [Lachnospiraceae bacterium]